MSVKSFEPTAFENTAFQVSTDWTQSLADTVALSDLLAKGVSFTEVDVVGLSALFAESADFMWAVSDGISLEGVFLDVVGFVRQLDETLVLSDEKSLAYVLAQSDFVVLTDGTGKGITVSRADMMSLVDTTVRAIALQMSDAVVLSDTAVNAVVKALQDICSLYDQFSVPVLISVAQRMLMRVGK